MQAKEIYEIILGLLKEKLNVNPYILTEENLDEPLTGRKFGFLARDLIYLFFEIEKKFNIEIDLAHLDEEKFNSINGIYQLVEEQISCG